MSINGDRNFEKEQDIQDWIEELISEDQFYDTIRNKDNLSLILKGLESSDFWPSFPIDYLTRIANIRAAQSTLKNLHSLILVSKNNQNISLNRNERMFADLLCCSEASSNFVLFEIKNRKGTARETLTELLAYDQEFRNHLPFSGSSDLAIVLIAREYTTILDHAVTSANTWSRKRILCLRFDDSEKKPKLEVHIPSAWHAIGQAGLPYSGIPTATLSITPNSELGKGDIFSICSTAAQLFTREAERTGGSGFAMVCHNQFYPTLAESPYLILIGSVDPYLFLSQAEKLGLLKKAYSPILAYLLDGERYKDLSLSRDWLAIDGNAAFDYLSGFGKPSWEFYSSWNHIRDIRRWKSDSVTLDRYISPVSCEFWGGLGDFAREIVRRPARLREYMPSVSKPGIDWRHPTLGVLLLDELTGENPIEDGQWTFSSVFSFGMRIGRLGAFSAQFADADVETKQKLIAPLFWSQVDALPSIHEVNLRYLSAKEIEIPPPPISIGEGVNSNEIMEILSDFADWFQEHFITNKEKLMQQAFGVGATYYSVFDPQFDYLGNDPKIAKLKEQAVQFARQWLKYSVIEALGKGREARNTALTINEEMEGKIPLEKGKEASFRIIDEMQDTYMLEKLFQSIPKIVDSWHPQIAHTLAPLTFIDHDWDWYKEQIQFARKRGEKHPCIFLSAGGQIGVGKLSDDFHAPQVSNPDQEVLFVNNESGFELTVVTDWESLKSGTAPGMAPSRNDAR